MVTEIRNRDRLSLLAGLPLLLSTEEPNAFESGFCEKFGRVEGSTSCVEPRPDGDHCTMRLAQDVMSSPD
jgi:hypothetical protein